MNLESCNTADCGPHKQCVIRSGQPKCICSPNCKNNHRHHRINRQNYLLKIDRETTTTESNDERSKQIHHKLNPKHRSNTFQSFNKKVKKITETELKNPPNK